MNSIINIELMKNPVNWIIVPLIVLFSMQLLTVLFAHANPPQQEN